jgi:UDP-glucuronate 4-epimerase|tara:strand:+ start:295 stop:1254 length:960 start_codon:yes stop_codon:yes gene_type:complete
MQILITGASGFIGYNLAQSYLKDKKNKVYGIDCLDDYYSVALKKKRLNKLKLKKNFFFKKIDLCDYTNLNEFLKKKKFDIAIHLAAQAGVRYSIVNPQKYLKVNILGYLNLLKLLNKYKAKKILYASSSSVYGDNINFPLKEKEKLNPKNVYGLTKKLNEIIAEYYFKKYNTKIIGLRFFTVFGEWGRPDMFFLKLFKSLKTEQTMFVNNYGDHVRDFTYVGDVVKFIDILSKKKIKKHDVYNICSNKPVNINEIIKDFKKNWKFKLKYKPMDSADIYKTHGSNLKIIKFTKFKKFTDLNEGIQKTLNWYLKEKIYKLS